MDYNIYSLQGERGVNKRKMFRCSGCKMEFKYVEELLFHQKCFCIDKWSETKFLESKKEQEV